MSKIYIVMENNWEYNDEYHSDSEGGTPKQAYTNREMAEREKQRLNREEFSRMFTQTSNAYNESPAHYTEGDETDPATAGERLWKIFHEPVQDAKDFVQSLSVRALALDDEHAEEFLKIQAQALTDPVVARETMVAFLTGIGQAPEDDIDYENHYWNFMLPPEATDAQVDAVMEVFDWILFFYVAEIDLK